MALPTPVQSFSGANSIGTTVGTNDVTATTATGTTAGNLILVVVGGAANAGAALTVGGVTDDKGNTYTAVDSTSITGTVRLAGGLFQCPNSIGGVKNVTGSFNTFASVGGGLVYAIEVPITTASPLDKHTFATGATTSPNSGNTTTLSQASEYVLGWAILSQTSGTPTPSSPNPASNLNFIAFNTFRTDLFSDGLVSSTTAVNSSYSFSGAGPQWICGVATFKVTVTSQTQTGKAKITATTSQTQLGKGDVRATTLQTQTGKTRLSAVTPKTQLGKTRVTIISPQTQLGKGDIKKATSNTIAGTGNLSAPVPHTMAGVADITGSAQHLIRGVALILHPTWNQYGISRITKVTAQTQAGVAHIATPRTILGVANIQSDTNRLIRGLTSILRIIKATVSGVTRVEVITPATITAQARINKLTSATLGGLARIFNVTRNYIYANSLITVCTVKLLLGRADISKNVNQSLFGRGAVLLAESQLQTGKGRIEVTTNRSQLGVSKIVVNPYGPPPKLTIMSLNDKTSRSLIIQKIEMLKQQSMRSKVGIR